MRWVGLLRLLTVLSVLVGASVGGQSLVHAQAATGNAAPSLTRADLEPWLDAYMAEGLRRENTAGAVVVVVKDGAVLLQKGYGFADVAAKAPVIADQTVFRAGSVSKVFTWTAVMQLVERGKIDLDRDVNAYLDFKIPPRNGKPVTMRNLLTHTAGFEDVTKDLWSAEPSPVIPLERMIKDRVPARVYDPGTTPAYSNYGTALAAYIVSRVSGETFDDYMDRHVLGPLGMTRSSFRQPLPAPLKAAMTKTYAALPGPPQPYEQVGLAPAGSLSTTGADMARFMIAHLEDGRYGGTQLLQPATVRSMHGTALTILPPLNRMLLGFYEDNINGHRISGHNGDTQFSHALLRLFTDDGVGLYISVNTAGGYKLRSDLFEAFSARYFPPRGPAAASSIAPEVAAEHARLIAGRYDNSRGWRTSFLHILNFMDQTEVVANDDGTISLKGDPVRWREIQPFVWQKVGGRERLAAKVVDNRVVRFSIDDVSPYMVFDRIAPWKSAGWLTPLFHLSLGILLLTTVAWPVAWIVRRIRKRPFDLKRREVLACSLMAGAALASLLVIWGWKHLLDVMIADFTAISSALDGWVWGLYIASLLVFPGSVLLACWILWLVWTHKRSWVAKSLSILVLLASSTTLWIAIAFKLIAFNVNY